MGNISSLNFQKTKISKSGYCFQLHHNSTIRPNYAIGGELICNQSADEAQIMRDKIIKNAKETYQKECKARNKNFQAKSYLWSAVVNIKDSTTMADLEKLSAHFKDKYGFQCYQIAIHRDEGHIDELGNKRINHHAHLEFVTLDERTGKNQWKNINKTALSRIQDEVAEILQMERGEYVEITGAKHLSGRAYGAMKQREKAERKALNDELNSKKSLNEEFNQAFNDLDKELELPYQNNIADSAKSYISKIKKIKDRNAELEQQIKLNAEINEIEQKRKKLEEKLDELKKKYEADRERFKRSKKATQKAYSRLKQIFEYHKSKIKTEIAALDTPKPTETTQGVEITQKTEPKIDAPVDDIDKKIAAIDEAIAKTNSAYTYNMPKTNLDMPRNDFNDTTNTKPFKKR